MTSRDNRIALHGVGMKGLGSCTLQGGALQQAVCVDLGLPQHTAGLVPNLARSVRSYC